MALPTVTPGLLPSVPQSSLNPQAFASVNTPMGVKATAPTPTAPSNSLPSGQSQPIDYTLHNGESIQAYNARIAAARGSGSTGGTGGGGLSGDTGGITFGGKTYHTGDKAPDGYQWNAQGTGFVPVSNYTFDKSGNVTGTTGPTYNTNPYTATAPTYGGLIGSLAGTAATPSPAFTAAQQQAQQALADLQTSRTNEANALSLNAQTPIPLEFQQGRGQILQNQYLAQQNAYANTYQGATAQETAATGQQSAQQSGLGAAAGLLAPQLGQYGQTYYNPLQGAAGTGGAAGVSPSDLFYASMQTYAQALASGQSGAIPSSVSGNPALMAQLLSMAKQINPNFNYNTSLGTGAAQQSNVQTAGTAGVSANQQVFNQAYGTYTQLQNTVQNVDQFGSLLTSGMQTADGTTINPSDVKWANQTLAAVRNQLSVPEQATYDTTLAALKSKISGLLSVGGNEIPSQITADANKILDGSLPLGSLNAVLGRIQSEGNILLQNQAKIVNNAYSGIQSGTPSGSSSGSSGTITAGGYTFTQNAQGQWVAQ